MTISIRNPEVARLARQVAQMKGVTMTEAIRLALANEVEEHDALLVRRRAKLLTTISRTANLPRLTEKTDNEILGYDESGLPT